MTNIITDNNFSDEIDFANLDEIVGGMMTPENKNNFYHSMFEIYIKKVLSRNNENKNDPFYKLLYDINAKKTIERKDVQSVINYSSKVGYQIDDIISDCKKMLYMAGLSR